MGKQDIQWYTGYTVLLELTRVNRIHTGTHMTRVNM